MINGKGWAATLAATAAALAACGSSSNTAGGGGATPTGGAGTEPTATASPSPSAKPAAFSCDIKPGAGLLPSATPKPGRIVVTIAGIESSVGLSVTSSVDVTMLATVTQCRYQVGQGGQLDITFLNDPAQSSAELAKTKQQNLALHDRGCNGCSLSNFAALPELGPDGYKATSDGDPVFGSITAGTYFEVEGVGLKDVRLERLALTIAANLGGGPSPSLPPLPTPTPS